MYLKVYGYTFRGSNFAIFIFVFLFNWDQGLKGRIHSFRSKLFLTYLVVWESSQAVTEVVSLGNMVEKKKTRQKTQKCICTF